jgi:hypothetical protein
LLSAAVKLLWGGQIAISQVFSPFTSQITVICVSEPLEAHDQIPVPANMHANNSRNHPRRSNLRRVDFASFEQDRSSSHQVIGTEVSLQDSRAFHSQAQQDIGQVTIEKQK